MSHPSIRVLCFGEVLWDALPAGRLPGGAPLNVAYHLRKLGAEPLMISAVGADALGAEMLTYLAARGLDTRFIARNRRLPTGVVTVTLNPAGHASYVIEEGVAWDDIGADGSWRAAVGGARAVVFGSLAARTAANRAVLDELLGARGLLRVMDVNLRPPFDEMEIVLELARRSDWIKLNEHELQRLSGVELSEPGDSVLLPAVEKLVSLTGCRRICVTRGEQGALLWHDGHAYSAHSPSVVVKDTIGAGDAFTAALVHGLVTAPGEFAGILERACALGALVASLPGGQPDYRLEGTTT